MFARILLSYKTCNLAAHHTKIHTLCINIVTIILVQYCSNNELLCGLEFLQVKEILMILMVFIALHVTVHTRLQACPLALSSASCLVDYLPFHSRHAAKTQSSSDSLNLLQCTITSSKSCLFRRAEQ